MKIKTGTRNVKQSVRRFTNEQKMDIIRQIDGRPENVKQCEMFKRFNLGKGNLYYKWKESFGLHKTKHRNMVENVKMVKKMERPMVNKMGRPMVTKTNGRQLHTVTLSVEVGSIMELINFCSTITKTPKVKSVLSVE